MNILNIAVNLTPEWGGPTKVISELTEELANKKDVNITIFSPISEPDRHKIKLLDNVNVELFKEHPFSRFWVGYSPSMVKGLEKSIKLFELVHIHELWSYPHFIAYRMAKKYNKPILITPHGELQPWMVNHKSFKKNIYLKLIQKPILENVNGIHAISLDEVNEIKKIVPEQRIFSISNGINFDLFDKLPNKYELCEMYPSVQGKKVILFLGRIHEVKGIDLLAKTFVKLYSKRKDIHLIIAGSGDNTFLSKIKKILLEENAVSEVTFTGLVSDSKKIPLLRGADICVIPSYSEVRSLVALEAMACEVPIIITRNCGFPEVSKVSSGIEINHNVIELENAINRLLGNKELCMIMGKNGRELVKAQFTWSKSAECMKELYQKLINENKDGDFK